MSFKHFINTTCEFLPCHKLEDWKSCLFCYCPLFLLGCSGNFSILPTAFKDCSQCIIPHTEDGWEMIQEELQKQLYHEGKQYKLSYEFAPRA